MVGKKVYLYFAPQVKWTFPVWELCVLYERSHTLITVKQLTCLELDCPWERTKINTFGPSESFFPSKLPCPIKLLWNGTLLEPPSQTHPELMFYQLSEHSLAQSRGHIKLTIPHINGFCHQETGAECSKPPRNRVPVRPVPCLLSLLAQFSLNFMSVLWAWFFLSLCEFCPYLCNLAALALPYIPFHPPLFT